MTKHDLECLFVQAAANRCRTKGRGQYELEDILRIKAVDPQVWEIYYIQTLQKPKNGIFGVAAFFPEKDIVEALQVERALTISKLDTENAKYYYKAKPAHITSSNCGLLAVGRVRLDLKTAIVMVKLTCKEDFDLDIERCLLCSLDDYIKTEKLGED